MHQIIVDTENYAGNFERQMCAFVTGQVGDCGVGESLAKEEIRQGEIVYLEWWEKHIVLRDDPRFNETVIRRPVAIAATPGWFNSGLGHEHRETDDERVLDDLKQKVIEERINYDLPRRAQIEKIMREKNYTNGWTEQGCQGELKSMDMIVENLKKSPLKKHPAYLSVAIFVDQVPPPAVMEEFNRRVDLFAKNRPDQSYLKNRPKEQLTITNIRVEELEPTVKPKPGM